MIPIDELTPLLGQEDAAFSAWRNTVPDKHWVKLDLSALRVGYELGKRTLAQQQGGELLNAASESRVARDDGLVETGAAVDAIMAALRTKQPAASEGDWRVDLQQFRPAVVNWRNEQRGTIKQLEDSVSQLGSGIQKLAEDRLREADRLLAIIDNTSKQAAGEAVAWQIMRAAFVTADENYSGKRVAAVYADASMIGQRVRLIFDTTPPTQQEARAVGCRAKLAPDQWFHFCGETDMGQTLPVLCEACEPGGLKRA